MSEKLYSFPAAEKSIQPFDEYWNNTTDSWLRFDPSSKGFVGDFPSTVRRPAPSQELKWIPLSESVPNLSERVLIAYKGNIMFMMLGEFQAAANREYSDPVHWLRIPDYPRQSPEDPLRKEFEAIVAELAPAFGEAIEFNRDPQDGHYWNPCLQQAWEGWKKNRKSAETSA